MISICMYYFYFVKLECGHVVEHVVLKTVGLCLLVSILSQLYLCWYTLFFVILFWASVIFLTAVFLVWNFINNIRFYFYLIFVFGVHEVFIIVLTFLYTILVFLLVLVSILEILSDSVFIYSKEKYLVVVIVWSWLLCTVRCSVNSLGRPILRFVWSVVTSVVFKHISLLFTVLLLIVSKLAYGGTHLLK